MRRGAPLLVLSLVAFGSACGGDESSTSPPCVVSEEEMASIWDEEEMRAAPTHDGQECVYLRGDEKVAALWIRTHEQFMAERKRFTDLWCPSAAAHTGRRVSEQRQHRPTLQQPERQSPGFGGQRRDSRP
jgi:hypothetical protein